MPNSPDNLSDRTNLFKRSAAGILIELGRLVHDHARGLRFPPDKLPTPEDIAAQEEKVADFFKQNSKAKLRPFVSAPGGSRAKGLSLRACRIFGYLAYLHIYEEQPQVGLMRVAKDCSLLGDGNQVLEWRRVVCALGVNGIVAVVGEMGFAPKVRLSNEAMDVLLGGPECLSLMGQGIINAWAEKRNKQSSAKGLKPGIRQSKPKDVVALVRSLPETTPDELFRELSIRSYVGQEAARKMLCLAACRHLKRLRRIYLEGVAVGELPPGGNFLLKGPTACGKTSLVRLLFSEILRLPFAGIDVCSYSETGYVGFEVREIPTSLVLSVDGCVDIAQTGVISLDSFDKLAEPDGRGLVSRLGVQRAMLSLLEPGVIEIPSELDSRSPRAKRIRFDTTNVMYVAMGAFPRWEEATGQGTNIGFIKEGRQNHCHPSSATAFERYGIEPELIGRFSTVVELNPLDRDDLRRILVQNVIPKRKVELEQDGIGLTVTDEAVDALVDQAMAHKTGARGLQELEMLNDACYEAYSGRGGSKKITLHAKAGQVVWDLTVSPKAGRKKEARDSDAVPNDHSNQAVV